MVISEQGYGKRSEIEDYRKTNRAERVLRPKYAKDRQLVSIQAVTDDNDLVIINKSGITTCQRFGFPYNGTCNSRRYTY